MRKNFYNPHLKIEFIESYTSESTRHLLGYIFETCSILEGKFSKDLSNFTLNEIEKLFKVIDPYSKGTANSFGSIISKYISWCIDKENLDCKNPLADKNNKWFESFVDKSKTLYINISDLLNIDKEVVAQDSVILFLLFEGVWGEELSELTSLNYNSVNWNNNILRLKDKDGNKREITVSDKCMAVIERAYKEDKYHSVGSNRNSSLVQNDYILKNVKTARTKDDGEMSKHGIYRRLSNISDYYKHPFLTANNIRKSGMIKMAADFYFLNKNIDNIYLKKIAEKFNVKKINVNNYLVYPYSVLRDFINEDNILKLYKQE